VAVSPGDTLVMATDGIRSGFAAGVTIEYSPQEIAESILARYAIGSDDAHVVGLRAPNFTTGCGFFEVGGIG